MAKHTKIKGPSTELSPAETATQLAVQDSLAAPEAANLTWEDVRKAIGPASTDERAMYAVGVGPDERLALGRRITSNKILTDLLRWSGDIATWLARTPAASIESLVGFSVGHVRVAVEEGLTLRSMLAQSEGRSAEVDVVLSGADAAVAGAARAVRYDYEALYTALDHATRADAGLSGKLAKAYSKATMAGPLATAVRLLCPIAREVLGQKKSPIAARLAKENVTVELVAALEKSGLALAQADERSTAPRAAGPVTERALNLQDGTCLAHMQWLLDFFDALHAKDPSAPHLMPIATRTIFGTHARAQAASPPAAPIDTPKTPA